MLIRELFLIFVLGVIFLPSAQAMDSINLKSRTTPTYNHLISFDENFDSFQNTSHVSSYYSNVIKNHPYTSNSKDDSVVNELMKVLLVAPQYLCLESLYKEVQLGIGKLSIEAMIAICKCYSGIKDNHNYIEVKSYVYTINKNSSEDEILFNGQCINPVEANSIVLERECGKEVVEDFEEVEIPSDCIEGAEVFNFKTQRCVSSCNNYNKDEKGKYFKLLGQGNHGSQKMALKLRGIDIDHYSGINTYSNPLSDDHLKKGCQKCPKGTVKAVKNKCLSKEGCDLTSQYVKNGKCSTICENGSYDRGDGLCVEDICHSLKKEQKNKPNFFEKNEAGSFLTLEDMFGDHAGEGISYSDGCEEENIRDALAIYYDELFDKNKKLVKSCDEEKNKKETSEAKMSEFHLQKKELSLVGNEYNGAKLIPVLKRIAPKCKMKFWCKNTGEFVASEEECEQNKCESGSYKHITYSGYLQVVNCITPSHRCYSCFSGSSEQRKIPPEITKHRGCETYIVVDAYKKFLGQERSKIMKNKLICLQSKNTNVCNKNQLDIDTFYDWFNSQIDEKLIKCN